MMRIAFVLVAVCCLGQAAQARRIRAKEPPRSCSVTIHKATIDVDNETKVSRQKAVIVCKRSMRARVSLDKDYSKTLWAALEKDFKAAKIAITKLPVMSRECLDNPLAKGCS